MLKPRLKSKTSCPYGGTFDLNIPEKGMKGSGTNFEMLVANITTYRKANGVPCGLGMEEEIERETCLRYPAECREMDPRVPPSSARLALDDIVNGTRMLAKFKLAGAPIVSDEEASRRAAICAVCPLQSSFTKPCSGICQQLKDLILSIVGAKTTKYDDRLQACRVCKCHNQASVWVPLDFSTAYLSPLQKEQFAFAHEEFGCWKFLNEWSKPSN